MSTVDGRCVCGLVVKVLDMISMQVRIPVESQFGGGGGVSGFLPMEKSDSFSEESQLWQSCADHS